MKTFLMYRDHNFELQQRASPNEEALIQDLELDALFDAMANGDKFMRDVARRAVLSSLTDVDSILFRQSILRDCLKNPDIVRHIYKSSVESLESEGKIWAWVDIRSPNIIIIRSVEVLLVLLLKLKELRDVADAYGGRFESEGFKEFFAVIKKELPYEYLLTIQNHLMELRFDNGALIGAELGQGNKGINYSVRKQGDQGQQDKRSQGWTSRLLTKNKSQQQYSFTLDSHDESGARMLSELREMGINSVANALAQSADHVLSFFRALRTELGFYLGCMNLQEQLTNIGEPTCVPIPVPLGRRALSSTGIYDACLALKSKQKVIPNDVNAKDKDLIVVTGANRGGKSTFLRSIGLAQLMMQCGALVAAESFSSDLGAGLFTHFKREEDPTMRSGKLDEELSRMSDIVDNLSPNCVVLLNESFAATNEMEGSEIASQVVNALLESKIKVFFVTHQYEFAHSFYEKKMTNALFLRAERREGGERTFKIIQGEPLQTSYGEDLYNTIFPSSARVTPGSSSSSSSSSSGAAAAASLVQAPSP
jgi:DNA mismatch repair ATPase MutS